MIVAVLALVHVESSIPVSHLQAFGKARDSLKVEASGFQALARLMQQSLDSYMIQVFGHILKKVGPAQRWLSFSTLL